MMVASIRKNAREELRVTVEEFKGVPLVNLRVWFQADDGEMRPGKQGLALRVDRLPDLLQALEDAEAEAERQGLMPDHAA